MSAPLQKAGPIAYCLASVIVYGLMINCGDKPTLSRISSKCRTAEASDHSDTKKTASGTAANKEASGANAKKTASGTAANKNPVKAASLTASPDDEVLSQEAEEATQLYGLTGDDDYSEDNESLGLADDAETFYNSNVKSIIEGKCANCHPKVSPPPLDSYTNVKKVSDDVLRTMKATDRTVMPPGGALPEADIAKVAEWVQLLSAPTSGGSTSTSTSKSTNTAPRTSPSKNTGSSASAAKDECKASSGNPGIKTGASTGKSTGSKSGTGTSTAKK